VRTKAHVGKCSKIPSCNNAVQKTWSCAWVGPLTKKTEKSLKKTKRSVYTRVVVHNAVGFPSACRPTSATNTLSHCAQCDLEPPGAQAAAPPHRLHALRSTSEEYTTAWSIGHPCTHSGPFVFPFYLRYFIFSEDAAPVKTYRQNTP
jgi:hypothetical protein